MEDRNFNYNEVDPNEINTLNVGAHKDNGATKKIIAVVLAGCTLVGAIVYGCARKNNKEEEETLPSTSQEQQIDENSKQEYELVLYSPVDVDNSNDLQKLVDEVNKNNAKDTTTKDVKLTQRMVKYFNGRLTKADFKGLSDDEILEEVRSYGTSIYKILSPSILEYKNAKDKNEKIDENKALKEALAVALTLLDKDDYTYKTYAALYDGILNEQKCDILMGNKDDYKQNSKEFGELANKILADKKVNAYNKALIASSIKAIYILFYGEMTLEDQTTFKKDFQGSYLTYALNDFVQNNAIITDVKDGKSCQKPKTGSYFDKNDQNDANKNKDKYVGTTKNEESTTKLVSKGGTPAKGNTGKQEVIKEPTTVKKQEVATPSTTEPTTKYEAGNKPVGKPETSVKPAESVTKEHKEPGTEPTTVVEHFVPTDEDGVDVYDPDEFEAAKKVYSDADLSKGYAYTK